MGQRGRPRHPEVLTPREQDVLALVREGLTNEQIAGRLGIGFETAKHHVAQVLSKLGVETREEAAAWREEGRRWALVPLALKAALVSAAVTLLAGVAFLAAQFAGSDAESPVVQATVSGGPTPTGDGPTPSSTEAPLPPPAPGGRIFFWRDSSDGFVAQDWFSINPDGSGEFAFDSVSGDPELPVSRDPGTPSPDAQWIAYTEGAGGLGYDGTVYVSRPDGSGVHRLGDVSFSDALPPCKDRMEVTWSPDSSKLAYGDDSGVTVVSAGDWTIVDQFAGTSDDWSPDSSSLATTVPGVRPTDGLPRSFPCQVAIRDVAGHKTRVLTAGTTARWSPDGSQIAFSRAGALYLMSSDGSDQRRLGGYGDLPAPTTTPFGVPYGLVDARWSPNGRRIAATIDTRLWVFDPESGDHIMAAEQGYFRAWSPDSNWIAFIAEEPVPGATPYPYNQAAPVQEVIYIVPANASRAPQRVSQGWATAWR